MIVPYLYGKAYPSIITVSWLNYSVVYMGPFKCYVTPWGGGVSFPGKKLY